MQEDQTIPEKARLQRIINAMLSLALLFERLIGLPRPLRRLVLWILRPVEAVAHNFVLDYAEAQGARGLPASMFEPPCYNSRDEARRLAECFHDMVWALENMSGLRAQMLLRDAGQGIVEFGFRAIWRMSAIRKFMRLASDAKNSLLAEPVKIDSS